MVSKVPLQPCTFQREVMSAWERQAAARAPAPGLSRSAVTRPDGSVLNTCPALVLAEILRFLKRCYWPFAWTTAPAAPATPQHKCRRRPGQRRLCECCAGAPCWRLQGLLILLYIILQAFTSCSVNPPAHGLYNIHLQQGGDVSGRNVCLSPAVSILDVHAYVLRRLQEHCLGAWAGCSACA